MPYPVVESFPSLFPGDIAAQVGSGKLYSIVKTKQIKAVCRDTKGQLWDVRMTALREATAEEKERFHLEAGEEEDTPIMRRGHVVRFKPDTASAVKYPGLYVVIKDKGPQEVSLVKLGGDLQSRYFASVVTSALELVPSGEFENV